jgi:hypothetical protein
LLELKSIEFIPSGDAFVNVIAIVLLSIVFVSFVDERFAKTSPTVNKPPELRLEMLEA